MFSQVETDFSYQGPPLSFFNLDVELLIEGLPGILDCSSYIFHRERGYGEVYKTNVWGLYIPYFLYDGS